MKKKKDYYFSDIGDGECHHCANADFGEIGEADEMKMVFCKIRLAWVPCLYFDICKHYKYENRYIGIRWSGERWETNDKP